MEKGVLWESLEVQPFQLNHFVLQRLWLRDLAAKPAEMVCHHLSDKANNLVVKPEGSKSFLMYNARHEKEELWSLLPLQGTEHNNLSKVFDLVGRLLCYKVDTHSRINRMSWLCVWRWRAILACTFLTCFCFLRHYGHVPSCSEKLNNLTKVTKLIASRSRAGSQFYCPRIYCLTPWSTLPLK